MKRIAFRTRVSLECLENRTVPAILDVGSNVNISHLAGNQWNGSIAIDPTNPARMFAISDTAAGNTFAAYSTNSGTTWASISPILGSTPRASFDSFGNLFVATDLSGSPRVSVSVDGGQTFGQIFAPGDSGYGRPALATGPGSAWLAVRGPSGSIIVTGALVSGLGNIGSFGAFKTIPNTTGGDIPAIAIGPAGQALVAYQNPGFGSRRSTLLTSLDADGLGAGNFSAPAIVSPINIGGFRKIPAQNTSGIDSSLSLAWDRSGGYYNGRVYLAYTNAPSATISDTNVFIRYSTNDGTSWSAAKQVNDDPTTNSQFNPVVAVDQTNGHVAMAWLDARRDRGVGGPGDTNGSPNNDVQVFASVSYDGGFVFVANRQVSDGADASNSAAAANPADYGRYIGLAFHDNALYPAWSDNSAALPANPDFPKLDLATVRVDVYPNAVTSQHSDLNFDYIGGAWNLVIHDDDSFISYPTNQTALYVAPVLKSTQPGDPNYDFIGAGAGNPVWILPQLQNPAGLWLGTSSESTPSNAFASYFESDPRIGFTAPWMKISVLDVRGPGEFSMWQTDTFGAVTVWVATSDGLQASDVFFSLPGSHVHYNFGLTEPGTYEIDLQASAYLQYPNNPTFSAVTTYTFCVDDIDNGDPPVPIPPPNLDQRPSVVSTAEGVNNAQSHVASWPFALFGRS